MAADDVIESLTSAAGRTDVIAEGVDEQGPYVRFRHQTRYVGRMAGPHWHPVLTERFTLVTGSLRMVVDGTVLRPSPGETVEIGARHVHEFGHDGGDELVFDHVVRPPGQHRSMFEVLHALDTTGRLTRSGLPRNPLVIGLLWGMQDGYLAGPPVWLQHLVLGGLDRLARRLGLHRRLALAVGRTPDRWDRPAR